MAKCISPGLRLLQRFLSLRPVTWLMARVLHRADAALLRLSRGRMTFAHFAGLPIIELTTTGARSGQRRTLPLTGLPDGDRIILIASNFGRARHPGWYHNLKADPRCIVSKDGRARAYVAREADVRENQVYFDLAISYYFGYAAYRQRAGAREIPVMVLDPETGESASAP